MITAPHSMRAPGRIPTGESPAIRGAAVSGESARGGGIPSKQVGGRYDAIAQRIGHGRMGHLTLAHIDPLRRCGSSFRAARHPLSANASTSGSVALFKA